MERAIFFLCIAACASAQNGAQFLDWKRPMLDRQTAPVMACAGLRSLTGYDFTVATAVSVPAAGGVPAFCRVSGQVMPQVRFEVSLPAVWNGRLYMFGNGGFAGESFDSTGRINHRNRALTQGFAVAATNTGHDAAAEPLATFAADRQKFYDYAFRSLHVTAESAKRLARAYYGSAPAKAYFDGCSTGGRQGLILAQRFPADFDGIVVGAPVLNFSATMTAYAWTAQALREARIDTAKLPLLASRIYAQCDDRDGLQDGLIDDPRKCGFAPARDLPKCAAGEDKTDCFTAPQIATLEKIYGDVMSQGKRFFPGWPVGAEIAGPNGRSGWEPWITSSQGPTISTIFADSFFRNMAFPQRDLTFDFMKLNFDTDIPKLDWVHGVLDATDADLTDFKARGGRILMYYGWADPALNALMGVEYYEQVRERMGPATADFFRLFMVPGMFHCAGGVGAGTFDAMTPLVSWVERGTAPDTLKAARILEGKPVRTRPLCPYPQVAKYKGTGSIEEAANFSCVNP